jgi:hypothetical protein
MLLLSERMDFIPSRCQAHRHQEDRGDILQLPQLCFGQLRDRLHDWLLARRAPGPPLPGQRLPHEPTALDVHARSFRSPSIGLAWQLTHGPDAVNDQPCDRGC